MAKGNISRKMKKINGGSLSGDGNLLLEKCWRKIGSFPLTAADEKKFLVFSPTVGSDADTAYIKTPAFKCEKLRVFIYSPMNAGLSAPLSAYVNLASDNTGASFDTTGNKRFFAWSTASNSYDTYSFFDIVTSPYIPTYTEGFATGRLGTGTVMSKQVSLSATEQNLTQITGLKFEMSNSNYGFFEGMRFVIMGVDK